MHVGLKELKQISGKSYKDITYEIIKSLENAFEPSAIVVPTFTWSFIKTGIFSINNSRSETGAFADLFREFANYRTSNTIQSFSIKANDYEIYKNLNHQDTFAQDGIYEYFRQNDTYIIDINTDTFRASPLHHVEIVCKLPYLAKDKVNFKGITYDENDKPQEVVQSHGGTFIYSDPYVFNKEKIRKYLMNKGMIKKYEYKDINISSLSNQDMHNTLEELLNKKPYFAITI